MPAQESENMPKKEKWKKPVLIIISRGNENGNVLLTCKQVRKGCTIDTNSKIASY